MTYRTADTYANFTDYAADQGVTPTSAYADIVDCAADYYSERRPHASDEQVEAWADSHAAKWAQ